MGYIIVWRNSHREPFVDVDGHNFLETYSTYEQAETEAKEVVKKENDPVRSPWYFDYQIYEEANS